MKKESEYKLTLKKIIKHFHVVNKHRFKVFCLCCRVGIPLQGILHDFSKYYPVEFFESARYYAEGKYSPINNCKSEKGYSNAWIHHKNHNKHHYEYWYDYSAPIPAPIMPFKYFLELVCDSFAAGIIYQGNNWHQGYQLEYWNLSESKVYIHPKMEKLIERVYVEESKIGLKKVLKKRYLKELYDEYTK